MNIESYYFICPGCKKGYRGILYNCPHCGIQLRDKPQTREQKWNLTRRIIDKLEHEK